MQHLIYTFLLLFLLSPLTAQYLHMPQEIEQIIKDSKLNYQIDSLDKPLENLVEQVKESYFKKHHPSTLAQKAAPIEVKLVGQQARYIKKAKSAYDKKKYQKAIDHYKKVHEIAANRNAMDRIRGIYEEMGLWEEAINWCIATKKTFKDYAQYSYDLASLYLKQGEGEKALNEVTLAHLRHPNQSSWVDLQKIYAQQGLLINDWELFPQRWYAVRQDSATQTVNIEYWPKKEAWLSYARCKAVWMAEPGYAEDMVRISTSDADLVEEKECLLNAVLAYEKLDEVGKANHPELRALARALETSLVNAYILYEMNLRYSPETYQHLTEAQLEQIIQYLQTIRTEKVSEVHNH